MELFMENTSFGLMFQEIVKAELHMLDLSNVLNMPMTDIQFWGGVIDEVSDFANSLLPYAR